MKKALGILILGLLASLVLIFVVSPHEAIAPQNTPTPNANEEFSDLSDNSTGLPLTLPPGFTLSVYASKLGNVRVLQKDPNGVLTASLTKDGKIIALPNKKPVDILTNLSSPHGFLFKCDNDKTNCKLYVAEEDKLSVYDYNPSTYKATNRRRLVDLPANTGHNTRSIIFAKDQTHILISVGSSCNVCHETDDRRAKILITDLDGKELKNYASGLRNSVFLAYHPVTGDLWATEMGRDYLGDNNPPDEINVIKENGNYGWPICYGNNMHDTSFDKNTYIRNPCEAPYETPSYIDLPAHSAPLGLGFIPETKFWPKNLWNNLLVVFHGSWNRTSPTGYKIVQLILNEKGEYQQTKDFITGWLTADGKVLGRPADILINLDGTAYISDDQNGSIYLLQKSRK